MQRSLDDVFILVLEILLKSLIDSLGVLHAFDLLHPHMKNSQGDKYDDRGGYNVSLLLRINQSGIIGSNIVSVRRNNHTMHHLYQI